ncbi:MAG: nitroreductase family protein [Promethearchaeota archaeon]
MKERRSIRAFKNDLVSDDDIQKILKAARWCQSASNRQPWRFIVIKNKKVLEQLSNIASYGKFIKMAPVAIAVIALKGTSPNYYLIDTSMVSHQICLMAYSLGLGTCWIGSLDREKGAELLKLETTEYLTTVLPLGYPKIIPKPTPRKDLTEIVTYIK